MSIDTGTFVAGVGVLVTLDLAVLGISVTNVRKLGDTATEATVEKAVRTAREAEEQAQYAHTRLTNHLADDHGKEVQPAREALADGGEAGGD